MSFDPISYSAIQQLKKHLYTLKLVSGTNLSGHRAISTNSSGEAIYADNSTTELASAAIGITTGASTTGSIIYAITNGGTIVEPSWSWTPQLPIFLGTSGLLTQTAPTIGAILQLGIALSATKMIVDIKMPIILT
jgi:hypothetical protein